MEVIKMNTSNSSYNIYVGENILAELLKFDGSYDKILLITNDTVGGIYKEKVISSIDHPNVFYFEIKDGEEYKNIETAISVYDFMIEKNFSRKSLVITLGGGVVCDLGGYVAATFMRGIDFIQIPTSLLAQVDASIGGKVAVDHPNCKNLIGVFKQPKAVIVDIEFLRTLPVKEFKSGMGEIIKHSLIIKNDDYFKFLKSNYDKIKNMETKYVIEMVRESCMIKKYFVEIDEFEQKERAFLNLGHNYGHALESIFKYKNITHGEAVCKGVVFDLEISEIKNYISKSFKEEVIEVFKLYDIEYETIYVPIDLLMSKLKTDKKNSFNNINFVLLNKNNKDKEPIFKEALDENTISEVNENNKNNYIKSVIDIGTNSCRLLISNIKENSNGKEIKKIIFRSTDITKLGENLGDEKLLKDEAMERTIEVLSKYQKIAFEYGSKEVFTFATSATRDAKNRDYFIKDVFEKTGLEINCISGDKEAEYNFNGASLIYDDRILTVDIGGGSTEFTLGEKKKIEFMKSVDIGAVRGTGQFLKEGYSESSIANLVSWVESNLESIKELKNQDFKIVALGGTATTQVSVKNKMKIYNYEEVNNQTLNIEDLNKNLELFLSKNIEERKKIDGLDPKRADVIIAGTIILKTILKFLNKEDLIISEYDNLFGAMIESRKNN